MLVFGKFGQMEGPSPFADLGDFPAGAQLAPLSMSWRLGPFFRAATVIGNGLGPEPPGRPEAPEAVLSWLTRGQ